MERNGINVALHEKRQRQEMEGRVTEEFEELGWDTFQQDSPLSGTDKLRHKGDQATEAAQDDEQYEEWDGGMARSSDSRKRRTMVAHIR